MRNILNNVDWNDIRYLMILWFHDLLRGSWIISDDNDISDVLKVFNFKKKF